MKRPCMMTTFDKRSGASAPLFFEQCNVDEGHRVLSEGYGL